MISFDRLAFTDDMQREFDDARSKLQRQGKRCEPGCVISLDRGFPLVCTRDGQERAELATPIKKSDDSIVAIGDWVAVHNPRAHEKLVIERVLPRRNEIARVKRVGRDHQLRRQVLAANVDIVFICQSLTGEGIDDNLLVRQMAAVAGCDAQPMFVFTKADLVDERVVLDAKERIERIAPDVPLFVVSIKDASSVERLLSVFSLYTTALLLGESGVGKSSLVNAMVGQEAFATGHVRASDDKGRHTTVARRLIALPDAGLVIDAPGLRTLQILDMDRSLERAFEDIAQAALGCRFRDCTHGDEPGCAVRDAIAPERLEKYRLLRTSDR